MKPTNKYERHIVALAEDKIKSLSPAKMAWLENTAHHNYVTTHYNKLICLECNHSWVGKYPEPKKDWKDEVMDTVREKKINCPSCKKTLDLDGCYNSGTNRDSHGVFFDRIGPIAVIRIFYIRKYMYKHKKPEFVTREVVRKFFDPIQSKFTIMSRGMNGMMGGYQGGWNLSSELSIKKHRDGFDYATTIGYHADIHPYKKIPKEISRMGFTIKNPVKISCDHILYGLMKDSRFETLVKNGEYKFLEHTLYSGIKDNLWSALKICFRNYYHVKDDDVTDYMDYVDLLSYFGKDVSNPKYACPEDLHKVHDKLVNKKRRIDEVIRKKKMEEDFLKDKEEALKKTKRYIKTKAKYFKLIFKEKDLIIEVMKSVDEFLDDSAYLRHCLFTNKYYEKENSLILSAKLNGEVIETIEVNLKTMKLVQARGFRNKPTSHNTRIVKLVERNLPEIQKIHTAKPKKKKKAA